ncbi:MAG: NUDIX hydrolase [Clostridia bacterium]
MDELRNKNGLTLAEFLAAYDVNKYQRPSVTADVAVFTLTKYNDTPALCVLLVKRADHPQIGWHALPGGFVNMDEDTLCAAARELREETGIEGLPLRQFATFGAPDRDVRTRVITLAHYAVAPMGGISPLAGDDAAEAELFRVQVRLLCSAASAETYRITLHSADESLVCHCQLRYDELGAYSAPLPGGQLASDHPHVLFSALCALNSQPRRRMARLLCKAGACNEDEAILALDEALCDLPRRL